jgi:SIR2-like protein
MNAWVPKVHDLGTYLHRRPDEPLCFVIGAGASVSSGMPLVDPIARRFDQLTEGRFSQLSDRDRRAALDRVTEDEKRAAIEDLFLDDLLPAADPRRKPGWPIPHVGVRCLAAMGRRRRVYVLNFNWDLAVEAACKLLGIPCQSLSLGEDDAALDRALRDSDPGVVVIHLHGQWDRAMPLGYATLETLSFDDRHRELLDTHALRHTTIVAGLSLADDVDTHELINKLSHEKQQLIDTRPLYICMRGDGPPPIGRIVAGDWLSSRRSEFNNPSGPDMDFDRLMVELRAGELGVSFEDVRDHAAGLNLPHLDKLVWPRPDLVRGLLDSRVMALVGEPTLGKSTVAHLVAFCRVLCGEAGREVRTIRGKSNTLKALTTALNVPGPQAVELVIEDPFGQEVVEDNDKIPQALRELVAASDGPGVIVTSRLHNWQRIVGARGGFEDSATSESDPRAWYAEGDLIRYLRSFGGLELARLEEAVKSRTLNTPARIRNALDGFPPNTEDPGNVGDKTQLLATLLDIPERRAMAVLVTLARLQELSHESKTRCELLAHVDPIDHVPEWRRARSMLFSFTFDGHQRLKLQHSTDREAVDAFLVERHDDVDTALKSLGTQARWALEALSIWDSLHAVRNGEPQALTSLDAPVRTGWAGALVAQAAPDRCWQVIELLMDDDAQDFWSLCDLVYETLGRWDELSSNRGAREHFVATVLADRRRMGAYALLEATLYLQEFTPPEVWFPLQETIRQLAADGRHDFELALIFDGLVWRPPAISEENRHQLLVTLLDAGAERDPLMGAYAVACAYHPEGAAPLTSERRLHNPFDRLSPLNGAQAAAAAQIVRFHFAHQSRARAAWARRPFEGGDINYLAQTTYGEPLPLQHAEKVTAMVEALAQSGCAGWAVHLGLNIQNTRGTFSDAQMDRIMAVLPGTIDDGVISAAATYHARGLAGVALTDYFKADPNRRELALDRLRDGFELDGWKVKAPAFRFLRDPSGFWATLGCDWERLNFEAEVDTSDPATLVQRYEESVERAIANGADPAIVVNLLGRARRYDLRPFEAAAAARDGEDPYLRNLLAAARLIEQMRDHRDRLL